MFPAQSDSVAESIQILLTDLRPGLYLTDSTGKSIVSVNPIGSWLVELIYEDNLSSIVHCSNINLITKNL